MYNINSPIPEQQDLINKSAGVVIDPNIAFEYQKQALEHQKHEDDTRARLEAKRLADMEHINAKIQNTPNQVEEKDIADKVNDFHNYVVDQSPNLSSKDFRTATNANLGVNQKLNELNNIIQASKTRDKIVHDTYSKIETERQAGGDFHKADIDAFDAAAKKSYVNGDETELLRAIPQPALDVQKLYDRNYAPQVLKSGDGELSQTRGLDGTIINKVTFKNDAAYQDAKKKMLLNSSVQNEMQKQIDEAVRQNPSNEDIYYKTDENGNKTPLLGERLDEVLAAYRPADKLTTTKGETPNAYSGLTATKDLAPINDYMTTGDSGEPVRRIESTDKKASFNPITVTDEKTGKSTTITPLKVWLEQGQNGTVVGKALIPETDKEKADLKNYEAAQKKYDTYKSLYDLTMQNAKTPEEKAQAEQLLTLAGEPPVAPTEGKTITLHGTQAEDAKNKLIEHTGNKLTVDVLNKVIAGKLKSGRYGGVNYQRDEEMKIPTNGEPVKQNAPAPVKKQEDLRKKYNY